MILRSSHSLLAAGLLACSRPDAVRPPAEAPGAADLPVVMVLGTSLAAGQGIDPELAYPAVLQHMIDSAGYDYRVLNRGVSGETSAGAAKRAAWLLQQPVAVLVLETGGNDGLRGLDPGELRANIQAVIDLARSRNPAPEILLLGMEAPPNLGASYTSRFREAYRAVAAANSIPLVPFVLEGVAGVDSLNQADGIHPTPEGHRRMAGNIWPALEPLLRAGVTRGG
ncbi:MAG TPA: arylesterase [Gemmatimonadales bacterium]|nr:arylesterase [Gemmatimonadales bacterium]